MTTTAPGNPGDPFEALHASLVELDLTSLAKGLSALLDSAERDAPSFSEFLHRALEIELAARLERKIERRVRWSRLGPLVTLDDFDFSCRPELSPHAVREFLTGRFIDEHRNLLLVGRPSTGKTTVARAIGHAACRRLHSVLYVTMGEMLEELLASRADHTFRKAFRRLLKPDLLVLDDAGFANLDRDASSDLFRLVAARHRKLSTLVVSNLPFKAWAELLPSEPQAVAIVDRLIDQASILRFSGKSFRVPRDVLGAPLDGEASAAAESGTAGAPPAGLSSPISPVATPAASPTSPAAASTPAPGASPPTGSADGKKGDAASSANAGASVTEDTPVSAPGHGGARRKGGAEKSARKKKEGQMGESGTPRRSTATKPKSSNAPRPPVPPPASPPEADASSAEAP